MNCPKCGEQIVEGALFCHECGTKTDSSKVKDEASGKIFILDKPFYLISLGSGLLFTVVAVLLSLNNMIFDPLFSLIMAILALCIILFCGVVAFLFVYSSWALIQNDIPRTTPAKAAGFLLIPLFNLYWVFQAIYGFAVDYNRYAEKHSPEAPRLNEKVFLGFSILFVLTPLFLFIPAAAALLALACWLYFIYLTVVVCDAAESITGSTEPITDEANKAAAFLASFKSNRFRRGAAVFIGIAILALVVTSLIPRGQFAVSEIDVPHEAVHGDRLTVTAEIENTGNARGLYKLCLFIDEQKVGTQSTTIDAESSELISFDLTDELQAGSYEANIGLGALEIVLDDYLQTFKILTPPDLYVSSLRLNPEQMNYDQETLVKVEVSNDGEAGGSMILDLLVNGNIEASEEVTLAGEAKMTTDFNLQFDDPGLYTIEVNGTIEELEVFKIERPANGTMLVREAGGGTGHLIIENHNSDVDVVVVLADPADPQTTLMAAYVRADNSYTMRGIRDGSYVVYYCEGNDWDTHSKRFTKNPSHGRFETQPDYKTTYIADGYYYDRWEAKFGIITEGPGARTESVDPDDFPPLI